MTLDWSNRVSVRLARTAVLIAFLVGATLSAAQVYLDYREEGDLLDNTVDQSHKAFRPAATRAVFLLDRDLAKEVVEGFHSYGYVARAAILDDNGNALAEAVRDTVAEHPDLGYTRFIIDEMVEYRYKLELPDLMAENPGELVLIVDRAVGLEPFISRAMTVFFSGLLRNFLLAMFLYLAFYGVITKPLRGLVEKISDIDPEQPGEKRVELSKKHDGDEFGMLASQINQSFDAVQVLLDNLRSTNRALTSSEEALRLRSWELEQEVDRAKRTSQELIATKERAEAANRAKSVFLANVSHELRTPLNAIIGFSSIMAEEMFGPIGHDKYRQYLMDIRNSSQHLSEVLGEVLDLAKIEAEELDLEEELIDMKRLCEESQALVSNQATQKGLKISFEMEEEVSQLWGDRLRLKQSVLNLLSNAVKFTPKGRKGVEMTLGQAEDGHVYVSVKDNGIGIAKEEQQLIFSPFMRSATALSRSHEGSGLGLSLVRAFVDMHDGWITLDSVVDEGATFTLHLPVERIRRASDNADELPEVRSAE